MAVTNASQLESPIAVDFKQADSESWTRWAGNSKTNDRTSLAKVRQRRFMNQIAGLLEVQSEDGIAMVVAGMLQDLESQSAGKKYNRFRIVRLPIVQPDEWRIAERFIREGQLPEALQPGRNHGRKHRSPVRRHDWSFVG